MLWRVVVLAELIDPVASSAHLSVALRASEPEIVPVDRASCRIAVTIEGSDGLDAGERALGLISDALGAGARRHAQRECECRTLRLEMPRQPVGGG